jgi:hypothetical protein
MNREIKFRIIELPTHQVLLTKDFDDDEESTPLLTIEFFIEGVKCKQSLSYSTEEDRDKVFETITDEQSQSILDNVILMFES